MSQPPGGASDMVRHWGRWFHLTIWVASSLTIWGPVGMWPSSPSWIWTGPERALHGLLQRVWMRQWGNDPAPAHTNLDVLVEGTLWLSSKLPSEAVHNRWAIDSSTSQSRKTIYKNWGDRSLGELHSAPFHWKGTGTKVVVGGSCQLGPQSMTGTVDIQSHRGWVGTQCSLVAVYIWDFHEGLLW